MQHKVYVEVRSRERERERERVNPSPQGSSQLHTQHSRTKVVAASTNINKVRRSIMAEIRPLGEHDWLSSFLICNLCPYASCEKMVEIEVLVVTGISGGKV